MANDKKLRSFIGSLIEHEKSLRNEMRELIASYVKIEENTDNEELIVEFDEDIKSNAFESLVNFMGVYIDFIEIMLQVEGFVDLLPKENNFSLKLTEYKSIYVEFIKRKHVEWQELQLRIKDMDDNCFMMTDPKHHALSDMVRNLISEVELLLLEENKL